MLKQPARRHEVFLQARLYVAGAPALCRASCSVHSHRLETQTEGSASGPTHVQRP